MAKYTAGFIGAGNMGGALAKAASKGLEKGRLVISDKNAELAAAKAEQFGCESADNITVARECRYVFLGVKPQYLNDMLSDIAPTLKNRADRFVVVSMAAGVPIKRIRSFLGEQCPVIRIMPNTPCGIGGGMVLYHPTENVSPEEVSEFTGFMKNAGLFDELPENLIDAGCAISGCGPAFVDMFIDALADGGVMCGLSKKQAVRYACQTLIGAAGMAALGEKSPADLKDAVCSPAGSTIAGVKALEDGSFRADVMEAVKRAFERTVELGK